MKTKVLVSSFLTIALCLCLIAGSTFALFEDEAEVNIAITAGNLDVTATIKDGVVQTKSANDATYSNELEFDNGGKVVVDEATQTIAISGMTPGDAIKFDVKVLNKSNVKAHYKVGWRSNAPTDPNVNDLVDTLQVKVLVNGQTLTTSGQETSYINIDPVTGEAVQLTVFTVEVVFPDLVDDPDNNIDNDDYQGAVADMYFFVEAIQGHEQTTTVTPAP